MGQRGGTTLVEDGRLANRGASATNADSRRPLKNWSVPGSRLAATQSRSAPDTRLGMDQPWKVGTSSRTFALPKTGML